MKSGDRPGKMPIPRPLLYGLLGLVLLFWSVNFIVAKFALREFPPVLLSGLRAAVAAAFIWPVYLWDRRRKPGRARWTASDLRKLLALGLCGVALNQLFFILGLSRTSVAHASILIATTPVMVLLAAASLRMERITAAKLLGMGVALAGVAVLNARPERQTGGPSVLGDVLIIHPESPLGPKVLERPPRPIGVSSAPSLRYAWVT